jgi:hypothetical protein
MRKRCPGSKPSRICVGVTFALSLPEGCRRSPRGHAVVTAAAACDGCWRAGGAGRSAGRCAGVHLLRKAGCITTTIPYSNRVEAALTSHATRSYRRPLPKPLQKRPQQRRSRSDSAAVSASSRRLPWRSSCRRRPAAAASWTCGCCRSRASWHRPAARPRRPRTRGAPRRRSCRCSQTLDAAPVLARLAGLCGEGTLLVSCCQTGRRCAPAGAPSRSTGGRRCSAQ